MSAEKVNSRRSMPEMLSLTAVSPKIWDAELLDPEGVLAGVPLPSKKSGPDAGLLQRKQALRIMSVQGFLGFMTL